MTFETLTPRQRRLLNRAICEHIGFLNPRCRLTCSANQGDILILDLELLRLDGSIHRCHALIANRSARPVIEERFLAEKIAARTRCCEATVLGPAASGHPPMAA